MEEGENQQDKGMEVSFPVVGEPQKKSSNARTFLIIGALVLVAILGFVIFKNATKKSSTTDSDIITFDNGTATPATEGTPLPSPSPSATLSPTLNRAKVRIQVQNGTGITGEAAFLQKQLTALGYTNIKVGNAESQDLTATQVQFASSLDKGAVAEITQKLSSLYQKVNTSTLTSTTFDVVITTGLQKGSTPKPSATPTLSPTSTP